MAFARLWGLDESWEVGGAKYETTPVERFRLVSHETARLWPKLKGPVARADKCHEIDQHWDRPF